MEYQVHIKNVVDLINEFVEDAMDNHAMVFLLRDTKKLRQYLTPAHHEELYNAGLKMVETKNSAEFTAVRDKLVKIY